MRGCLLATVLFACTACSGTAEVCGDVFCLKVKPVQHASGVGAAQGLEVRDGLVWVIGDGPTGVAVPFTVDPGGKLARAEGGIDFTVGGADRMPHPTGLTYQPGVGTFLGNTVGHRGEILMLDWAAAVAGGTLDGAILHAVQDGAARNGARPELVWDGGRWVVATDDYGGSGNELRLYDPDFLWTATNTDEPNVVIARIPSPPYVQSLHYWQARDVLVLVQNRNYGTGWKLTFIDLGATLAGGEMVVLDVLEPPVAGELEGFHFIDGERALGITSAPFRNASLIRVTTRS